MCPAGPLRLTPAPAAVAQTGSTGFHADGPGLCFLFPARASLMPAGEVPPETCWALRRVQIRNVSTGGTPLMQGGRESMDKQDGAAGAGRTAHPSSLVPRSTLPFFTPASLGSSPRFPAPTCLSRACFLGRPSKDSNVIFITLYLKALSCFRKTTCTHRSETSGNKKDTLKPSHALSRSGPLVVAGANWRACGPHGKAAPQGPWQALCDGEWGNGKASLRRAALGQRLSQLQRLSARLGVAAARPLMGWTSGARGDFSSPHRPTAPQQL